MTYSLIIPIYNESKSLPLLMEKLNLLDKNKIEIIIIDDGSNDNTNEILNQNDEFIIKRNKTNLGKGASIKKGIELASNEHIILIDGDLEVDINDLPKLISKYERNNSDVLTGVRWQNKYNEEGYSLIMFGNCVINIFFNILFKSNFKDVLCCLKILKLEHFKSLNIQSQGFSIEVETMAKLVLNKFSINEESINYNRRTVEQGKKLKFSDSWGIVFTMLKIKLNNNSIS